MEWILTVCTAAWILCGQQNHYTYDNEEQCYKAMDKLIEFKGADEFKYVICMPEKPKEQPNKGE